MSCGDAVLDAEGHVEAAAGSSKEKIAGYETDRITEALEAFGIEGSDDFPGRILQCRDKREVDSGVGRSHAADAS